MGRQLRKVAANWQHPKNENVKFDSIEEFRKDKIEVESKINELLIEFYKKYEGSVASFVFDKEDKIVYQTFRENKMPLVLTASPDISHFKDGFK